jgi:hypothetical protein
MSVTLQAVARSSLMVRARDLSTEHYSALLPCTELEWFAAFGILILSDNRQRALAMCGYHLPPVWAGYMTDS